LSLRPLNILAVEDSTVSFSALCLAIRLAPGWSIDHVRDAAAAMKHCASAKPDVVTLDLSLPGGGGLELLAAIKAEFALPIVVVSASTYEGSPVTAEALARGADTCFDKAYILSDATRFLAALSDAASTVQVACAVPPPHSV
jgi:chemotaxis response regulator CheB